MEVRSLWPHAPHQEAWTFPLGNSTGVTPSEVHSGTIATAAAASGLKETGIQETKGSKMGLMWWYRKEVMGT